MTQVYRLAIEKGFVYIKMADETAQIGETLEREYGKPLQSQDLHIKYFFLVLGKEIICKSADIIIQLQRLGSWCHLKTEWPEYCLVSFLRTHQMRQSATERRGSITFEYNC